jgi:hypothetical protein
VTVAACRGDGDELAVANCDLDASSSYRRTTFNFERHRQPWAYELVSSRKGIGEPVVKVYDPPKA